MKENRESMFVSSIDELIDDQYLIDDKCDGQQTLRKHEREQSTIKLIKIKNDNLISNNKLNDRWVQMI